MSLFRRKENRTSETAESVSAIENSEKQAMPKMPVPEEGDINLFERFVSGFSQDEEMVGGGMRGHYRRRNNTAYIYTWGTNTSSIEEYSIPDHVKKTRESINQYLRKEKHVFIPF